MKKNLSLLTAIVLTLFLVSLVSELNVPADAAPAASKTRPVLSSAGPSEEDATPPARPAQPVVFIVTGLVCALFGISAVSPLLVGDPARWKAAGVYLGGTGLPQGPCGEIGLAEQQIP